MRFLSPKTSIQMKLTSQLSFPVELWQPISTYGLQYYIDLFVIADLILTLIYSLIPVHAALCA